MSNNYISPNMGLTIPVPTQEPGPNWAYDLNASLTVVDNHNHVPGSGVQITPAGLNINANLPFNSNNAVGLKSVRFAAQGAPLSGINDLGCLYVSSLDLYYNDENGNQIRITQSGSVAGSAGTITGLPSGTASASFQAVNGTFQFQQSTSTAANIDGASFIVRYPGSYPTPSGTYIAIQAPTSLASSYAMTLPNTPAAVVNSPILMDTAGTLTTGTPASYFNPPGSIIAFGGSSAPTGWFICNGSAVSRTTYSNLFAAIGTAYGSGDGSTTFNIPDLRGQFLRGVTGASTNDPDASSRTAMNTGGNTGNNVGSVQQDQFQGHYHGNTFYNGGLYGNAGGPGTVINISAGNFGTMSVTNPTNDGVDGAPRYGTETRPINAYVNFIIKT